MKSNYTNLALRVDKQAHIKEQGGLRALDVYEGLGERPLYVMDLFSIIIKSCFMGIFLNMNIMGQSRK